MFEESVLTLQPPKYPGESTLSKESVMDRFRQATVIVAQDQPRRLYLTTRDIILVRKTLPRILQWLRPLGERFACGQAMTLPASEHNAHLDFFITAFALFAEIEWSFLSPAEREALSQFQRDMNEHFPERALNQNEPSWLLYHYLFFQHFGYV